MIASTIGCMMYLYWNGYFSVKMIQANQQLFEISQQTEQPVEIISYFCPYPNETTLRKSKLTAFLISFFVGVLGFDRFYLSHLITGLVKLCSFGGLGIWWIIDFVLIATDVLIDYSGCPLRNDL